GKHRGGNGVVRELRFLKEMSLSIVSQNRKRGPYGLDGGSPGQPGRQRVIRQSGKVMEIKEVDGCTVYEGDRLILETPGGGGFGKPEDR
ncbi:hydantoinase B/oxoprolinase family protein, partial [bacterium]|nr:hydantoinase B/oxoprolinase family protein [bacterium]